MHTSIRTLTLHAYAFYTAITSLLVGFIKVNSLTFWKQNSCLIFFTPMLSPWPVYNRCAINIYFLKKKEWMLTNVSPNFIFVGTLEKYLFSFEHVVSSKYNIADCHTGNIDWILRALHLQIQTISGIVLFLRGGWSYHFLFSNFYLRD